MSCAHQRAPENIDLSMDQCAISNSIVIVCYCYKPYELKYVTMYREIHTATLSNILLYKLMFTNPSIQIELKILNIYIASYSLKLHPLYIMSHLHLE